MDSCYLNTEELFGREFILKDENETQENCESFDFYIHHLDTAKSNLFGCMRKLNEFDLDEWSKHTRYTDCTSSLSWYCKKKFGTELCTRAWLKFYEILDTYSHKIFTPLSDSAVINSVHFCEAPGGFVSALNHFLSNNYPQREWNWSAITLNPQYEGNDVSCMIVDQTLIDQYPDNWYYGDDMSGDILSETNTLCISKFFRSKTPDLVTADGSIDCSKNPEIQELMVEKLIRQQALFALDILKLHGCFVLKVFTYFNHSTYSIIQYISKFFREVVIFKPSTSGHGNSEKYLICIDYLRKPTGYQIDYQFLNSPWPELGRQVPFKDYEFKQYEDISDRKRKLGSDNYTRHFNKSENQLLMNESKQQDLEADPQFIRKIYQSSVYFNRFQMFFIERNISLFRCIGRFQKISLESLKEAFNSEFIKRFKLRPLKAERRLLRYKLTPKLHTDSSSEVFQQRVSLTTISEVGVVLMLNKIHEICQDDILLTKPIYCLKYDRVNFSLLVSPKGMEYYHQFEKGLARNGSETNLFQIGASIDGIHSGKTSIFSDILDKLFKISENQNLCLAQTCRSIGVLIENTEDESSTLEIIKTCIVSRFMNHRIIDINNIESGKYDLLIICYEIFFEKFIGFGINQRFYQVRNILSLNRRLNMNGCLLLVIDNIQTNFTVDVIYYLAVCFNHLYIYRMINQPTIPYGFVIFCHGFKGLFGGDRVLEFEKSTEQDTHDYFIHHFCQDNSGIRIYLVEKLKKFLHSKRLNA